MSIEYIKVYFGIAVGKISEVPEKGRSHFQGRKVHLFLLLTKVLKRTGGRFLG